MDNQLDLEYLRKEVNETKEKLEINTKKEPPQTGIVSFTKTILKNLKEKAKKESFPNLHYYKYELERLGGNPEILDLAYSIFPKIGLSIEKESITQIFIISFAEI